MDVSVDYLLDGDDAMQAASAIREPIDLGKFEGRTKRRKKGHAVRNRFPDATIRSLQRSKVLSRNERVVDNVLGVLTDAPFGIPGLMHDVDHLSEELYLVDDSGRQFVVAVADEWIEIRRMSEPAIAKELELGDWRYRVSSYKVGLDEQ
ncbi:MAG: hypothetical protein PUC43_00825 [Ellagibacter isourolithinifaciens]|nr:hypothetical protein [Ellagibacter isourolithinifaciens]